ncbi:acetyltransferase GCN5 [Tistrella bauzanensis]|uniref:Acetyltransferase GCN5 n=1 Tax=Tistrella bauzanensis TaxID=657419 RepID=A0ABQ1IMQ0_9PROT|nr:GNAT family protein [Tistrella bauzanensis]GGB46774.1 acetyltransferase GCN5 [Tistrella bauzanensis]
MTITPSSDLTAWAGAPPPPRAALDGRYTRLEPFDATAHARALFQASAAPGADDRFRWLFETPPDDEAAFGAWFDKAAAGRDPLFFAVIDKATGRAEGRQALMRIDTTHGVIEIGSILWGPAIARTRVATEALFLFADLAFASGYRRFEWKCNAENAPSRRAAERFGFSFEGIFRQHMVVKGQNRDTAWFSITDGEWPRLKAGYQAWLRPENFDETGRQHQRLRF